MSVVHILPRYQITHISPLAGTVELELVDEFKNRFVIDLNLFALPTHDIDADRPHVFR